MKAAGDETVLNRSGTEAEREELAVSYDTVLPGGQPGDLLFTWAIELPYIGRWIAHPRSVVPERARLTARR